MNFGEEANRKCNVIAGISISLKALLRAKYTRLWASGKKNYWMQKISKGNKSFEKVNESNNNYQKHFSPGSKAHCKQVIGFCFSY